MKTPQLDTAVRERIRGGIGSIKARNMARSLDRWAKQLRAYADWLDDVPAPRKRQKPTARKPLMLPPSRSNLSFGE